MGGQKASAGGGEQREKKGQREVVVNFGEHSKVKLKHVVKTDCNLAN